MLRYFYLISGVVCVLTIGVLLMSPGEREHFPLTRFLSRRLFPDLDFHLRQRRISLICGILFAVFFIGPILAFIITRFGNR